jgi:hypothetical protein
MGFRTGAYATIWSVEDKGKYSNVKLTTSKKNKDGTYQTDFSGFVRFIGTAHENAPSLKEKDHIKIGDIDVTQTYDKESQKTYTGFALFSYEMSEPAGNKVTAPAKKTEATKKATAKQSDPDSDEDLPF